MPEGELNKVIHREINKAINKYNKWLRKEYRQEWEKVLKPKRKK